ncbi:ABC transporter ATP-binding protein [Thermicanus aegyptius]|uniref:ABC transporter ATP-binding protein n=1 Tax=Thermicanus aegyptius TaxID=94009 RepID=UPI0004028818|nr:ABC transporter ATP-binding protein [Thermicanus aegyptius]
MEKDMKIPTWKKLIQILLQMKISWVLLGTSMLLSLLATMTSLAIPFITKDLIDGFTLDAIHPELVASIIGAFIIQAVTGGISAYLLARIGQQIVAGLRERLWKKLLSLPISYYDRHQTGETISRVTNDTGIVKELISDHFTGFFNGIISMIGAVMVLFYLDRQLTLVMFTVIPLTLVILFPVGRQMYHVSKGLQDETAHFSAILNQVLSDIRLVKASNAERSEYINGSARIKKLYRFGLKEGKLHAVMAPLVSSMILLLLVIIFGFGGLRVASGTLTAGELVAFIIYLIQIVSPISQIAGFFTYFQKAMGATERILLLLGMEEEDLASGKPVQNLNQPIIFEEVSFSYKPGEPVLDRISFKAHPGQVTAIVGPSGSGKTTLFSLLERYYLPLCGTIKLGSDPIDRFSLSSWRGHIGYVSQESPIISGTIRENICYGIEREVRPEELVNAAKMAYADEFINELPEKYETDVGERGIKLSGGQRQRIAIARALLRDPAILLLDEATSSLDSQSEIAVQQALNNLMQGRTTLVIAHRLSTVIDADQIVFLEKGRITGIGSHQELFLSHPLYREFSMQQLRVQG